jgi:hypothetical protein
VASPVEPSRDLRGVGCVQVEVHEIRTPRRQAKLHIHAHTAWTFSFNTPCLSIRASWLRVGYATRTALVLSTHTRGHTHVYPLRALSLHRVRGALGTTHTVTCSHVAFGIVRHGASHMSLFGIVRWAARASQSTFVRREHCERRRTKVHGPSPGLQPS